MRIILPLAALGLALTVSFASATTLTLTGAGTTCSTSQLTVSLDCEGAYSGNASSDIDALTVLFGETGWSELEKVDASSGSSGGLTVTTTDGTIGTWAYSGDTSAFGGMIAILKGGPTFSAYLLDLEVVPLAGDWNTSGILKGNGGAGPELSNFTLWTRPGGGPDTPPVPLPAAGWMLLAGVGGLAAWGRRRRNAA